jgi:hypothetical protein
MELFSIIYADGTVFKGGTLLNSGWNEINKPIKELCYHFPTETLILSDYEKYNHIIVHRRKLQMNWISHIIILAKKDNMLFRFIYVTKKNKLHADKTVYSENFNGRPISGWKIGMNNLMPQFLLRKN